jgi:glycosyltransferase involved in cell wall biosynthesis
MHIAPLIMHKLRPARATTRIFYPRKLTAVENSTFARSDWKNVARLARYVDSFTSPAQYVIDAIVDASRDKLADRAFAVANGISPIFATAERIRPEEEVVRFLSCSRLDPEKRVDVIIKAFGKLNHHNAELYVLGTGSQDAYLKKLAQRHVKRGTVLFLGHYNDIERIANEYANSDVFVFASYRFDTQGMVLAEAAAAGTPVLYCDDRLRIGVSPDNALLVHPSLSGLTDGMRQLLHDPVRRQSMSIASKHLGKRLTAENMEKKFVQVYEYALKRPPLIQ